LTAAVLAKARTAARLRADSQLNKAARAVAKSAGVSTGGREFGR
jgi:hypothetical protein